MENLVLPIVLIVIFMYVWYSGGETLISTELASQASKSEHRAIRADQNEFIKTSKSNKRLVEHSADNLFVMSVKDSKKLAKAVSKKSSDNLEAVLASL